MKNKDEVLYLSKAIATVGVCWLGYECMIMTDGSTGVGWAILGVFLIWC